MWLVIDVSHQTGIDYESVSINISIANITVLALIGG